MKVRKIVGVTVKSKMRKMICNSERDVFERSDFYCCGTYSQIGRALKRLVSDGTLMRIGYGLYVKSMINSLTGRPVTICAGGSNGVVSEVLELKRIYFSLDDDIKKSLDGEPTKIPAPMLCRWNIMRLGRRLTRGKRPSTHR